MLNVTVKEVCEHMVGVNYVRVVGCYDGATLAKARKSAIEKCGDMRVDAFGAHILVPDKRSHSYATTELVLWVYNYEEALAKKLGKCKKAEESPQ